MTISFYFNLLNHFIHQHSPIRVKSDDVLNRNLNVQVSF
jgi:hypothetical protein